MVKERLSDDVSSELTPSLILSGRLQPTTIINEDGLYDVILESRKSEAREFRKWVTRDVLPSIRKTGMYAADELLDNPELLIHAVTKLKEEREARQCLKLRSSQTSQRYCLQMPCQPVKHSYWLEIWQKY
ncbi:BRO-N domain-containing protein [Paenibacillus larvae]|uniref:BRO-N domain-containing protein n=1 Tax=Paenibacillus larvae TaxID=1464 RepID=UPI00288F3F8A|nr:BRO family protein [Paenibacillus larvae]MDT2191237.1 BRO family protein [Paenibacillus larvae]